MRISAYQQNSKVVASRFKTLSTSLAADLDLASPQADIEA